MVTVVLHLPDLAVEVGVDAGGPFLVLVDGTTRVVLRASGERGVALRGVERLIRAAAKLGRELAG